MTERVYRRPDDESQVSLHSIRKANIVYDEDIPKFPEQDVLEFSDPFGAGALDAKNITVKVSDTPKWLDDLFISGGAQELSAKEEAFACQVPFTKKCRNCANFVPSYYEGKANTKTGRCTAYGFFGRGYTRVESGVPDVVDEIKAREGYRKHFEHLSKGYYISDLLEIKRSYERVCTHWIHPLTHAPQTFKFHSETLDSFPWAHQNKALFDWFKEGMSMDVVLFKRQHRLMFFEYLGIQPSKVLSEYHPCITCEHYEPSCDKDGRDMPHKGVCGLQSHTEGIASFLGGGTRDTYSFLTCNQHSELKDMRKKPNFLENAPMLFMYAEANPPILPYIEQRKIRELPILSSQSVIDEGEHDRVMLSDMRAYMRSRYEQIDHKRFAQDMKLGAVQRYFTKTLGKNHKSQSDFWRKFESYSEAEEKLFEA